MWGDTKAHTFHMVINMLYLISTQQVMKIDTYITNTYKWSYNFYSQISFPQPEAIGQKKKEKISSKIGQDKKTTLIFVFTQALTATVKIDSWSRDWTLVCVPQSFEISLFFWISYRLNLFGSLFSDSYTKFITRYPFLIEASQTYTERK